MIITPTTDISLHHKTQYEDTLALSYQDVAKELWVGQRKHVDITVTGVKPGKPDLHDNTQNADQTVSI